MADQGITLKDAVAAYLKHLGNSGAKESTTRIYAKSLDLALAYFGEEKPLTSILVPHVSKFYNSSLVNNHKNGRPKAEPTIKQNKRVFRQCMTFAKEKGFINSAPVPKSERRHARSKASKEPEKADTEN
jgi:hypothetical protein